jgi:RES domain-containing protein
MRRDNQKPIAKHSVWAMRRDEKSGAPAHCQKSGCRVLPALAAEIGRIKSRRSVILAVPSIVILMKNNFLINPEHGDFAKLEIDRSRDFAFDQQLFG